MRKILRLKIVAMLLLLTSIALAQDRSVNGRVTSKEDGSPLPGVNVVVKGSTTGTVTDSDGKYTVSVPSTGATLVFSFIGLKVEEVSVGEQAIVDVQLVADITQLSEIVVTGTGVATEKKKLAIAVESVTSDKLPPAPTASIDQALVGKIAGAQISSVDGTPGANINILLRGINTINRGTSPMILVDGVQMGATNLNSIDLNTVDRVEVVQGAAAATIYGAQGANGVIQLFTKKGKSGKLMIDVSSSISQNTLLNIGDVRKAKYHNFATDVNGEIVSPSGVPITWSTVTGVYTGNVVYDALDPVGQFNKPYTANLPYIDHFAKYMIPANTVNNSIVLSGGKDNSDFSISISNNHQQSNFKGDGYNDRTNFTTNLGFEVVKGLQLRSITQLVYTKNTINYWNQPGFGGSSAFYYLLNTRPFADYDAFDVDGNYGYRLGDAAGVNGRNPNYRYQFTDRADNKIDILQSFVATYKVNRFLELSAKYGLNYQTEEDRNLIANQSQIRTVVTSGSFPSIYNGTNQGEITVFSNKTVFQNFIGSATGTFDFDKDLKINVPIKSTTLVTYDYRQSNFSQYWTYGLNLPTFDPFNASQANTFKTVSDFKQPFVTYGYLVNQRFDFGDIAGISGGFRSDYSSAFGAGSTPFTFPRGDAYFRVSALKFWDNSGLASTILDFKLRAAFGKAGIQPRPFDRYQTLGTRVLGGATSLYYTAGQSNPNLNVEVSSEIEFGTDITVDLLKGDWFKSLNLSLTFWDRSTENAIYDLDTAPSAGVGTVKNNAFSLASNGMQFSLNTPIYKGSKINWNLTTNFSKQISKITSVTDNGQVVVLSNAGSSNYVLRAGETVGQLYGYKLLTRVDQTDLNGNPYIAPANQGQYSVASNGYVVNTTSKQPIGTTDLYSLGNSFPKFNMSFINDLSYGNFLTFSFQFDWVYDSHLYNQTKSWMYRDGISKDYETPITIGGETGAWTAFYRGVYQAGSNNGTKDYFYEDATFLRLRNVAVGVDFAKLFKLPAFRKLQLVLSGRNLMTITKYTGFDPEISSGPINTSASAGSIGTTVTNSAFDRGVDHSTLPNYRSYQATLNIGF